MRNAQSSPNSGVVVSFRMKMVADSHSVRGPVSNLRPGSLISSEGPPLLDQPPNGTLIPTPAPLHVLSQPEHGTLHEIVIGSRSLSAAALDSIGMNSETPASAPPILKLEDGSFAPLGFEFIDYLYVAGIILFLWLLVIYNKVISVQDSCFKSDLMEFNVWEELLWMMKQKQLIETKKKHAHTRKFMKPVDKHEPAVGFSGAFAHIHL